MNMRKNVLVIVLMCYAHVMATCCCCDQASTNSQSESSMTHLYFNDSKVYQSYVYLPQIHFGGGSYELYDLGACISGAEFLKLTDDWIRMREAEFRSNPAVQAVIKKLDVIVDDIVKRRANGQNVKLLRYHDPAEDKDYVIASAAHEHPELDITDEAIELLNKEYLESKQKNK
jgi:hypothetical protein